MESFRYDDQDGRFAESCRKGGAGCILLSGKGFRVDVPPAVLRSRHPDPNGYRWCRIADGGHAHRILYRRRTNPAIIQHSNHIWSGSLHRTARGGFPVAGAGPGAEVIDDRKPRGPRPDSGLGQMPLTESTHQKLASEKVPSNKQIDP